MKKVGVIGVTYEATATFYRMLCGRSQELIGPGRNPDILLHTRDFREYLESAKGDFRGWTVLMLDSISRLAAAGCDFVVCPANSNHVVYEEVSAAAELPWINMIEAVFDAVRREPPGATPPVCGILGTNFTVESDIFGRYASGIPLVYPEPELQEALHAEIVNHLVFGTVRDAGLEIVRRCLASIRGAGASDHGVIGLLLEGGRVVVEVTAGPAGTRRPIGENAGVETNLSARRALTASPGIRPSCDPTTAVRRRTAGPRRRGMRT